MGGGCSARVWRGCSNLRIPFPYMKRNRERHLLKIMASLVVKYYQCCYIAHALKINYVKIQHRMMPLPKVMTPLLGRCCVCYVTHAPNLERLRWWGVMCNMSCRHIVDSEANVIVYISKHKTGIPTSRYMTYRMTLWASWAPL